MVIILVERKITPYLISRIIRQFHCVNGLAIWLESFLLFFLYSSPTILKEENDVGEFFLTLEKDPQQEDFLQGRMQGNPYRSVLI